MSLCQWKARLKRRPKNNDSDYRYFKLQLPGIFLLKKILKAFIVNEDKEEKLLPRNISASILPFKLGH